MDAIKRFIKWALAVIVFLALCFGFILLYSYPQLRERGFFEQQAEATPGPTSPSLPLNKDITACAEAPFIVPAAGWIGILYGDSIYGTVNHSGLDIFGQNGNGVTPVYAAYDGYVTRLAEWVSAVIIRHPVDPLQPDRQIWSYYTHMADTSGQSYITDQFPPSTLEMPIKQGALLGYQGDYNGDSWRSIDTHLHFSIVLDDGGGNFLNETDITNTLDPSPYLGMRLNSACADRPPLCRPDFTCEPLASQ
jgi:hypothetical protein